MRSSVLEMFGQSSARVPDVGTLRGALVLEPVAEFDAPEEVGVAVVVQVIIVLVKAVPLLLLFALGECQYFDMTTQYFSQKKLEVSKFEYPFVSQNH